MEAAGQLLVATEGPSLARLARYPSLTQGWGNSPEPNCILPQPTSTRPSPTPPHHARPTHPGCARKQCVQHAGTLLPASSNPAQPCPLPTSTHPTLASPTPAHPPTLAPTQRERRPQQAKSIPSTAHTTDTTHNKPDRCSARSQPTRSQQARSMAQLWHMHELSIVLKTRPSLHSESLTPPSLHSGSLNQQDLPQKRTQADWRAPHAPGVLLQHRHLS